jgi:hypothetical protein
LPTSSEAGEPDPRLDPLANKIAVSDEHLPAVGKDSDARPNETAFVLAEVREEIESNPANKVVGLTIDPNYSCDKDSYLVNAVVVAREQRFSLGVIITLQLDAKGRKTVVAFVD